MGRDRNNIGRFIKTKRINKECLICYKKFIVYQSHNDRKFCSKKCYFKDKKGKPFPGIRYVSYGENHYKWNNGIYNNHSGYKMISTKDHPSGNKYIMEHRLVMEKHLGRYLDKKEVVHHINEIKTDNRIENLKLCTNESEHRKLHKLKRWSRKYEKCSICKTKDIKHNAKGLCLVCYRKLEWDNLKRNKNA